MRKEHILVTGGTGFLGQYLVKLLLKNNYKVTIISKSGNNNKNTPYGYKMSDLTKPVDQKLFTDIDIIIHLAGNSDVGYSINNPKEIITTNTGMLINILEAISKMKAPPDIMFASTDRMYGATKKKSVDESEITKPIEPYTASKIIGEIILESYARLYKFSFISFRIDSIYGPGQPERMFISHLISKMIKESIVPVGNLSVHKNFVHVEDVAQVFIKGIKSTKKKWNTHYNIGGSYLSLKQASDIITKHIEKKMNKKIKLVFDSSLVRKSGAEVTPFKLSCLKAKKELGWTTKVSLKKGLEQTVDSFLKRHEQE
jgi:nucleoside-diphosphate-sugar epimerase